MSEEDSLLEHRRKACERAKRWRLENPEKHKETIKRWRKNNPDMVREELRRWCRANPEKKRAYNELIHHKTRKGLLVPVTCSSCGLICKKLQAHHDDYSKPLEVRWVCHSCHLKIHGKKTRDAQDTIGG